MFILVALKVKNRLPTLIIPEMAISPKTIGGELGHVELNISRDRKGEYNPKIASNYSRDVSGIEEKVISLYVKGMSTRDIHEQIKEL